MLLSRVYLIMESLDRPLYSILISSLTTNYLLMRHKLCEGSGSLHPLWRCAWRIQSRERGGSVRSGIGVLESSLSFPPSLLAKLIQKRASALHHHCYRLVSAVRALLCTTDDSDLPRPPFLPSFQPAPADPFNM